MRPLTLLLCAALSSAALLGSVPGSARAGPEPARSADLSRFAGHWYVIARLPASGAAFGAQVEYRYEDGTLDEAWSAHGGFLGGPLEQKEVRAKPDPEQPGRWKVRTGWLGKEDRLLLYVSPGYRRAIVADGERRSAWLLAREPEIPEWSLAGLVARLEVQGYDVTRLRRVVQKPEQVGKPGFE